MDKYTFSNRLVKLMEEGKERKITQAELGKKLNLTRQAISSYITGASRPDCDKLLKIADFFNVSTDFLLGKTTVESPNVEMQAACGFTGLGEQAIGVIRNLDKNNSELLSELIILDTFLKTGVMEKFIEAFRIFLLLSTRGIDDSHVDDPTLSVKRNWGIASFNLNLKIADVLEEGKDALMKEYRSRHPNEVEP